VVAAGYSYSDAAGSLATIVKLTRTLMIIPITLFLAIYTHRKTSHNTTFALSKVFPWFVLCFLAASIISTASIISPEAGKLLAQLGKFLIVMAMAAIGLNTNIKQLISNGVKPIILGMSCWIAVALTSIAVQYMMNLW
jgi:uncharacterized membrane protein YadS